MVALLVVPLVASVCVIGAIGVSRMDSQVSELYQHGLRQTDSARLARSLSAVEAAVLQGVLTDDAMVTRRVNTDLDRRLLPGLDVALVRARASFTSSTEGTAPLRELARSLEKFERLRDGGALVFTEETEAVAVRKDKLAARIAEVFDGMVGSADALVEAEAREARSINAGARDDHRATLLLLLIGSVVALLGTLGVIAWLTRSIVPRARGYSRFAADVASGSTERRLDPAGNDELTELGVLLNEMVEHREREEHQVDQQTEFSEAMQMTESEDEAYGLLKRHLERSLRGATVIVLGRNNSADRLEARTPVSMTARWRRASGSQTAQLPGRPHRRATEPRSGEMPLIECEICGQLGPTPANRCSWEAR